MKNFKLFGILCLLGLNASATTLINQCNDSVWVAFGKWNSSEGPFTETPHPVTYSDGWHEIKGGGNLLLPQGYQYVRMIVNNTAVTKTDYQDKDVRGFCASRPALAYKFENRKTLGSLDHDESSANFCKKAEPNQERFWVPFQRIEQFGTFTISGASCNPAPNDPNRNRNFWEHEKGSEYLQVTKQKWLIFPNDGAMGAMHVQEERREEKYVVVKLPIAQYFQYIALGESEILKLENGQWVRMAGGHWK